MHISFLGTRLLFHALVVAILLFPVTANAGGILCIFPPTLEGDSIAVARPAVVHSRTLLTVSESILDYRMDQTFFNNNEFPLEGLFVLPAESGSALLNATVTVNGISTQFTLLSAEEFFPLLEELTVAMKDPSLLALAGKSVLIVRPAHIGAQRQKSIQVHWQQPNTLDKDQPEFVVPLDGERFSLGPVAGFEIAVRLKMDRPVRMIFSPTHHVSVFRETDRRCLVSAMSRDEKISSDFRLLTKLSGSDLDLRVLAHRQPNQRGSFLAFLMPPVQDPKQVRSHKDVVFVLDRSGSIDRSDLELGERLAIAGLQRLHPLDRFNVITVGTWTKSMRSQLMPATGENIGEAVRFISSLPHGGGTDLCNGVLIALEQLSSRKRPAFVVLAGDGRATVGITNPETIVDQIKRSNRSGARIFALALGNRADTAVLDSMAASTKGSSMHLSGKEDFESVMNHLLEGISPPQVSELALDFQDLSPEEMIPDPLPDVTGPEGVMVLGRYTGKNEVISKVRLRGKIKGRVKTLSKTFEFPLVDTTKSYVGQIWAMRKTATLLEKQRFKGPEPETTEQIASLANEFGFRTVSSVSPVAPDWGPLFWQFKTSVVPSDVASDRFRRVNDKIFRMDNGVWVDTVYRPLMGSSVVPFLSREYFDLVKDQPSLGPYFALGPDVAVVGDKGTVRVQSEGP